MTSFIWISILVLWVVSIVIASMAHTGGCNPSIKLDSIVITDSKNRVMAIIAEETVIHDDLRIYFCEDEPDFIENGGVIYYHE